MSAQEQTAEQAIERASLRRGQAVPVRRLVLAGVVTLAGFAAGVMVAASVWSLRAMNVR